jgi:GT2 family glycosyltransferase
VVIVSYNSEEWLDDCLRSIATQTHTARDIVLVDNGSREDPTSWVCAHHPAVRVVRLPSSESLAVAINRGCAAADGRYFLILNPDVVLEPDAIRAMVEVADADPGCAAVAPKLRFWWARPFLNGLGNRVEDESWGTDNAIGHLDLGQFDDWSELPSACYAATLVPRRAWDDVGPADEGFSLYYEDVEWSYRARVLGWRIRAAPDAIVYHAFGSRMASGREHGVEAAKLRHVVYGRRRFAAKLLDTEARGRFLHNYGREDRRNLKHALRGRHWAVACAYARGYADYISHLSEIRAFRRAVHARRRLSDHDLLAVQTGMPPGLTWRGVPELTMRIIDRVYRPLLEGRRTRPVPEFGLD